MMIFLRRRNGAKCGRLHLLFLWLKWVSANCRFLRTCYLFFECVNYSNSNMEKNLIYCLRTISEWIIAYFQLDPTLAICGSHRYVRMSIGSPLDNSRVQKKTLYFPLEISDGSPNDIPMEVQDTQKVGHFQWTNQYGESALGMRAHELRTKVYFWYIVYYVTNFRSVFM